MVREGLYVRALGRRARRGPTARPPACCTTRAPRPSASASTCWPPSTPGTDGSSDRLADAGGRAAASGAPESAAVFLRRALAEPPPGDAFRLLIECGLAEANAGEPGWYGHLQAAIAAAADAVVARRPSALTTAQALLREQRPEEALAGDRRRRRRGSATGTSGSAALLDAMAVAAGTLDARLTPDVAARSAALRRLVEADPAAPRERSSRSPRGRRRSATSRRPPGWTLARRALAASPRPTPDPADLPSTWFSLATIVLVWAERYAEAAALLETAVAECRAAGAGGNLATALTYRAWLALRRGDLRTAEVDARTGVEAADLPLPLLYRLIASRHPRRRARGARRARGGRAGAGAR